MSKKTGLNLRHALCGALLSLAAFPAQAVVSIGDISVQSFRDETLKALVELKADAGDTLTPQCLSLVKPDAEADNKLPYLTDGVVALDQRGGKQVVSITTTQAISGDGINLMLKIECPGQVQISRDFTVLLGTRSGNVLALPAAAPAAPTQSSALPPLPASGGFYWDMRAGDSLADIAQKIYPKEPLYQKKMVRAIIRANPQAFPDGKMQELSVGTVIIIPDLRSVPAVKVPEESGADKAPAKPQRKSRPPPAAKNEPPGEKTTTKSLIRGSQYLLKISWQLDSLPFPSHSETSRQFNRQTAESPYLAKIAELTQRLARADSELEKLRLKLATVFSRAEEVKRAIAQLETLSSAAKATPNRAAKTPPSVEKPASTAPPAAKTATAPEVKTAQMPAPIVKPAAPAVKAAPAAEKPVTRPEQQDDMLTWLVAGIVIVLLSLGAFYY
ncbi:MAG: type IV pilus assembly protein FimV, partial [Burkholderiales bacterium]